MNSHALALAAPRHRISQLLIALFCLFGGSLAFGQSTTFNPPYPRLAYGKIGGWGTYDEQQVQIAAKHTVAIIGLWRSWTGGGYNAVTLPAHIKSLNPAIKLFEYTSLTEVVPSDNPFVAAKVDREVGPSGVGDWWLYDAAGQNVTTWPTNGYGSRSATPSTSWRINISNLTTPDSNGLQYPQWFARYWDAAAPSSISVNTTGSSGDWVAPGHGLSEGAWDGVYSDVQDVVVGAGTPISADWNRDGTDEAGDSAAAIQYQTEAHKAYHDAWKALHPNWMFLGNMGQQILPTITVPAIYQQLNEGGWFEAIMGESWSIETWGGWDKMMAAYRKGMSLLAAPKIGIFNNHLSYPVSQLGYDKYRWNRYGLTSCLMDNGYYMASDSDQYTSQQWYDEFNINLGYPVDPPQTSPWSKGVYRREFDNGLVLVNPRGNGTQTVDVGPGWKRFSGQQDPIQNNGQSVTTLTLADADGIILVRDNSQQKPMPPAQVSAQ